jgi:hypothetical protein
MSAPQDARPEIDEQPLPISFRTRCDHKKEQSDNTDARDSTPGEHSL